MDENQSRRDAEINRLKTLQAERPPFDDFPGNGVVLSDGIEFYCQQFHLISPFEKSNVKPANYKLSVGDEYVIGGEIKVLADQPGKNKIVIPSFEVAVIKSLGNSKYSTISYRPLEHPSGTGVQGFALGRWPSGRRRLRRTPVLPDIQPVRQRSGTEPPRVNSGDRFRRRLRSSPKVFRWITNLQYRTEYYIEDYEPEALKSALATVVNREIRGFEHRLKQLEKNSEAKIDRLTNVTFTTIAILVAALAVVATSHLSTAVTFWTWSALFISVFALLVALGK